jgi:hypothetical protein
MVPFQRRFRFNIVLVWRFFSFGCVFNTFLCRASQNVLDEAMATTPSSPSTSTAYSLVYLPAPQRVFLVYFEIVLLKKTCNLVFITGRASHGLVLAQNFFGLGSSRSFDFRCNPLGG